MGHPSLNCSRPRKLNLGVPWDELSKDKLKLVSMSIISILLNPDVRDIVYYVTYLLHQLRQSRDQATQSLGYVYSDKIHIFIGLDVCTCCERLRLYCVSRKKNMHGLIPIRKHRR